MAYPVRSVETLARALLLIGENGIVGQDHNVGVASVICRGVISGTDMIQTRSNRTRFDDGIVPQRIAQVRTSPILDYGGAPIPVSIAASRWA